MNVLKLRGSYIPFILVALSILGASASTNANQVNGVAAYHALSVEQFLTVLYTSSPTIEAAPLLEKDTPARMEIRVTTKRLSQRRFVTMWLESMTVSNTSDVVEAQLESLAQFNKMFKGRFIDGDRIVFDYRPGRGMEVSVNGVALGVIKSGDFFRLLLACWVGEVPISSNLKASLLSPAAIDKDLLARFNAVTPSADRREEIVAWTKVPAKPEPVEQVQPKAEVVKAAPVKAPVQTTAAPKKAPAAVEQPKPAEKVAEKPVATQTVEVVKQEEKKQLEPKQVEPKAVELPKQVAEPPKQVVAAPKVVAPVAIAETVVELESDDETMEGLDAGGLLVRQKYYDQLSKHLIQQQSIPRQAFQRRLEDEVRVYLTIDRSGTVMAAELETESKYKMFNQQALEAIEKAGVFPSMPEEISGDTFSFSVLLNYRLPI
ncbi:TonB family protein [Saccharophagus degradans]|uniref:TonB family protein n=1 Tax=Saccharophagus degradans TaxID=86304 RepID=A0AAW7XCU8_9GAMM|nr:TonB family protein [Saccharophagus degradans]MDO6424348.1 TonB family protein [Saccharophagus degradans]MDO6608445.1 TonB family protein [Saccharophagus degradans]